MTCYSCPRVPMASGHGVREAIQTLSSLLSYYGLPKLPSETYRRAKFDNAAVVEDMWTLLSYTCQLTILLPLCQHECCCCGDFEAVKKNMQALNSCCDWTKLAVRKLLCSLGYSRPTFYSRGKCSSREALLAFGWVLHEQKLIERLRSMHLSVIKTCELPAAESATALVKTLNNQSQLMKHEVESLLDSSGEHSLPLQLCLHRLEWIRGKVDCEWKSLLSTVRSYEKLAHLLHTATLDSSGKHLSVYELVLLQNPEHLRATMDKLEKQLALSQAFVEWKQCAPWFWQWMESILDMEQQFWDDPLQEGRPDELKPVVIPDAKTLTSQVKALQNEATRLFADNQVHLEHVNAIFSRSRFDTKHLEEHSLKLKREPIHLCRCGFGSLINVEHEKLRHDVSSLYMLSEFDSTSYSPSSRKAREVGVVGSGGLPEKVVSNSDSSKQLKENLMRRLHELSRKLPPSVCVISEKL